MRLLSKLVLNGVIILNYSKIDIHKKEKIDGNNMTVSFDNKYDIIDNNDIIFKINDGIEFFAKYDYEGGTLDVSPSSPDLLFSGTIKEIKIKNDTNFRLTIECVDRTFILLNKLWGKSYKGKAPDIIKQIVDMGSFSGDENLIISEIDTTFPYTSGIQGRRPNDTVFPDITFGLAHKPVFEFLDALSLPGYTNTSNEINTNSRVCKKTFKYFIDSMNKFHWFYPSDTPDYVLQYGATGPVGGDSRKYTIISENLKWGILSEINFIIFKAGEDMNNVQILDMDLDPTTKNLTSADSFRDWSHIARRMKFEDLGNITFVEGDKFNYPSTYPVTPLWDSLSRSVSSNSEYNNNFRDEAKYRAKNQCKNIFNETSMERWAGKLSLYGISFEPTQLIKYTNSSINLNNTLLRIKGVTYNIDKSNFITILDVQEDEEELK